MKRIEGPAYALAVAFWLLTCFYALLSSQPFAYEQFLKPELLPPLSAFARWHPWLNLAGFAITLALRWGALRGPGRRATGALLGVWGAASLVLLLLPALAELAPGRLALWLAGLALAPVVLLAWAEWCTAPAPAHQGLAPRAPRPRTADDFAACLAAAGCAALLYAAVAGCTGTDLETLPLRARTAGLVESLLLHGLLFLAVFCVLTIVRGAAALVPAAPHRAELALATAALAGLAQLVLVGIVLPGASLSDPGAAAVGSAFALALALAIAARGIAGSDPSVDGVARVLRPLAPRAVGNSLVATGLWLLALGAAATGLALVTRQLDFNQLASRVAVVVIWLLVLVACLRTVRSTADPSPAALFVAAGAVLLAYVALDSTSASARLERASVDLGQARSAAIGRDPSFRLLRRLLEPPADAGVELFSFLQEHTNISRRLAIEPVDLSLAQLRGSPASYRPHIFLFLVDSLRRDYLSAYDPAVTFTPEIGRFAADATVFRHAFTRYGATGLSVPALWVGAPLLHKQYVTPFAPMNTLAKLLEHEGYAQWVGMDNILDVILEPGARHEPLDAEGAEQDFSFCKKLETIERRLEQRGAAAPPVFAYTLPQDIHVAQVAREGGRSIDEGDYPGFSAPVASRMRRVDACFGRFVDSLRRLGLYDDSVIILTSDHGDSLGEEGRIGHAYGLFPEVIRIPLIVSLPARLRQQLEVDPTAPVYNTDVTPTLYRLLGHELEPSSTLFGRALFTAPGERTAGEEGVMVASSYGAVYGALLDSATRLYIIDAVNVREYGYVLGPDSEGEAISVDARLRRRGQAAIRETIQDLADLHGYRPPGEHTLDARAP